MTPFTPMFLKSFRIGGFPCVVISLLFNTLHLSLFAKQQARKIKDCLLTIPCMNQSYAFGQPLHLFSLGNSVLCIPASPSKQLGVCVCKWQPVWYFGAKRGRCKNWTICLRGRKVGRPLDPSCQLLTWRQCVLGTFSSIHDCKGPSMGPTPKV